MILGIIEHDRGRINKLSLEMMTFGRRLAAERETGFGAVLIGAGAEALVELMADYGVSQIYHVQHPRLDDYAPEAWAQSVLGLFPTAGPDVVLAAGTDRGQEVMAHVAARANLPLAANCLAVHAGEPFQVTRQRWGGSLLEEATLSGSPRLMTVAPFVIAAEEATMPTEPDIIPIMPEITDRYFRVRITGRVKTDSDKISLADARIVIGGGRGVGSSEGFAILEKLAGLLGGAVGGSRVVTNKGWRSHADQIGQTGTRIAPDLYIACGISGAIQHMVGCKGAQRIMAINLDPEAPIIGKADYLVVGDLHEVLPALVEEIESL